MTFEKGRFYCIRGLNGVGKSTFFDLLSGLYVREYCGNIMFDNSDLRTVNLKHMRKNLMRITSQKPVIMDDSLHANLLLGRDTTLEYGAAKYTPNFLAAKSSSETISASTISGGEAQIVELARSLNSDYDLLLLDEPSNSLDIAAKMRLIEYIETMKSIKIIIAISHDTDLFRIADHTYDF